MVLVTDGVHYLCHDTGLIDGGLYGNGICPPESEITYFRFAGGHTKSGAQIEALECQQTEHYNYGALMAWMNVGQGCYGNKEERDPGGPTIVLAEPVVLFGLKNPQSGNINDDGDMITESVDLKAFASSPDGSEITSFRLVSPALGDCAIADTHSPGVIDCTGDNDNWDTTQESEGPLNIELEATDSQGRTSIYTFKAVIDNDPKDNPAGLASCSLPPLPTPAPCYDELQGWLGHGEIASLSNIENRSTDYLTWTCKEPGVAACSSPGAGVATGRRCEGSSQGDALAGKCFYTYGSTTLAYESLASAVTDAFRYRTRFVSPTGNRPGFEPPICVGDSSVNPYCYDPEKINVVAKRLDCLLEMYTAPGAVSIPFRGATAQDRDRVKDVLKTSFGAAQRSDPSMPSITHHESFEKLYAELLVTLGDGAYTSALKSRFDLAGMYSATFEGHMFEDGGPTLPGVAGAEFMALYKAVQYYDKVIYRFQPQV